jgi:hypothetical protein
LVYFFVFSLNQHFKKHNMNLRQYWLKHLKPPHMSLGPMMNGGLGRGGAGVPGRGGGVPPMRGGVGGRGGVVWGRGTGRAGPMPVKAGNLRFAS